MVLVKFNEKTKVWDIITREEKEKLPEEKREKVLYLDGELKKRLDFSKEQIKKNNDCIGIIDGPEGSGKSSMGGNIMLYMTDNKFDPKKHMIGSDYEDALDKLENVKENGALMFDEGNAFFLSTETTTREHRDLHKVFSIFRQKNLFVLIVMPSFFRLGTYFSVDRAKFLIHTYLNKGDRGFFIYFGTKAKNKLYRAGKKEYNHGASPTTFRPGRFTACWALETKEYKAFKLKTLKEAFQRAKPKRKKTPKEIQKEYRDSIIAENLDKPAKELAEMFGVTSNMINKIKRDLKAKQEEEN